jgi:hypothetical protein
MDWWHAAVTPLHNYPFHCEAASLAEVFRNVHFEVA